MEAAVTGMYMCVYNVHVYLYIYIHTCVHLCTFRSVGSGLLYGFRV